MCGIIGAVSDKNIINQILAGLKKLEYRGYDSSGIALIDQNQIKIIKQKGKIDELQNAVAKDGNFIGNIAIAHTRWATHGVPSGINAHPHSSSDVCVVHNGIIENYQQIKSKLEKAGVKFSSQTDSEVVPHLISFYLQKDQDHRQAILAAINEIKGSFSLAIIFKGEENLLVGVKKGSPLLIGYGEGENYLASDYFALDELTNKISYLEDEDIAFITREKIEIFGFDGKKRKRKVKMMDKSDGKISKENYPHFMLKEIFEQPQVIQDTIDAYLDVKNQKIHLPNFPLDLSEIDKITIIACGTSYYAAFIGKYLIESLAEINVEIDIASEFRYHSPPFRGKNLAIFISQSGETADSIAALNFVKSKNQKTVAIVNVAQSTMARLADVFIRTVAGPEIGVASTKAFTAQLAILVLFALQLADIKKTIDNDKKLQLISSLVKAPLMIAEILQEKSVGEIKKIAKYLSKKQNALYIGRGISYIIALEAALKLKELSYIYAQGIAAGELKHGTIALVDKKLPVIAIAPSNQLFEKSASNIAEVAAREGKIILISDNKRIKELKNIIFKSFAMPAINNIIEEALISVIPTQLLAYYTALYKGNDVDQPRNLAKSVTVE